MLFYLISFLLNLILSIEYGSTSQIPCQLSDQMLGQTTKHLFHFIQITDIHLSYFDHYHRTKQFEQFCNEIIKSIVKPQVTILSGDLVHNFHLRSLTKQYQEDWKVYNDILIRTNITQYTKWLDMRGNHDTFRDSDPNSNESFYRRYSYQGLKHRSSYQYTMKTKDNDKYSFVSIDMSPRPGLSLPFNFMGKINQIEMKKIRLLTQQTKKSNTTIFFGHYPLSLSYSNGINDLMSDGIVYLNGHLHKIIPNLYTHHSNGLIELQLADWKNNRQFRIFVIDGGIFSFSDFQFEESIYGIITNPKDHQFKTKREPLYRLICSTHIRIMIFNRSSIVNVQVSIDYKFLGYAIPSNDNRNLYILSWNPNLYNDQNLHFISVLIKDNNENVIKLEHQFSLSTLTSTKLNFSKLILFFHWPTIGILGFSLLILGYILLLFYYRYRAQRMIMCCRPCFTFWNSFRLRMMLLCSVDFLFYSLIALAFYHFIGPWYIGQLTDEHFGLAFLWGIFIRGVYQRHDMQPIIGTIQFIFFLFPFTYSLSSSCFYRYNTLQSNIDLYQSSFDRWMRISTDYFLYGFSFVFILFWSFVSTVTFQFGWILSPFGLTLPLFTIFIYTKSKRLNRNHFRFQSNKSHLNIDHSKLINIQEQIDIDTQLKDDQ